MGFQLNDALSQFDFHTCRYLRHQHEIWWNDKCTTVTWPQYPSNSSRCDSFFGFIAKIAYYRLFHLLLGTRKMWPSFRFYLRRNVSNAVEQYGSCLCSVLHHNLSRFPSFLHRGKAVPILINTCYESLNYGKFFRSLKRLRAYSSGAPAQICC